MTSYTEVFAWGGDHFGQLGQGTQNTGKAYCIPRLCSFNVLIREMACGDEHTAFVDAHGYVYTMGSNSEGRLGVSDRTVKQSSAPCLVEGLARVVTLSCGWGHTAAITEDGSMYTWGIGEYGALGLGTADSHWQPVRVSVDARFRCVSCGSRHTAAIASDMHSSRSLYTFGSGDAGQLGTGRRDRELSPVRLPIPEEVLQVSCGVFQTGFITQSKKLFMVGGNSFGQLGIGTRKSTNQPQRVGFFAGIAVAKVACGQHTAAVSEDGELYIWGTGAFGEFTTPQRMGLSVGIKDVSVGGGFGAAVDASGRLWIWGANSNGELGLGDYEARAVPTLLPSLASKRVRQVSCGGCYALALGNDTNTDNLRGVSPNSSRNQGKSPLRPRTSRSPLRYPPPISSERGNHSPFQPVRSEEDLVRTAEERRRIVEIQKSEERRRTEKSEERRRTELQSVRQEAMNLARMRELEDLLKRKEAELAESKARNDRARLEADESARVLESELQHSVRQTQSLSAENQRLLREIEIKTEEISMLKSANASLLDTNEKLNRDYAAMQKTAEELQRRGEVEARQRQDSALAQNSRLRDDFQSQLQDLQAKLDQEFVLRKQMAQDLELTNAHRRRVEESLSSYQQRVETLIEERRIAEERAQKLEQQLVAAAEANRSSTSRLESEFSAARSEILALRQELEHEHGLTQDLQADLSDYGNAHKSQAMLESAVNELKFEVENLHRKNNEAMMEIDSLQGNLQEAERKNEILKAENAELQGAVTSADAKNRELFSNFERELTSRAREYRERTMTVLASPGNSAKSGNQSAVTPPRDPRSTSGLRSDRYRGESPGMNQSVTSDRSPARAVSFRQDSDLSPERRLHTPERHSPPTFREGAVLGVQNSISEIRDKLASLQQNKSVLEAKMRDFERKIRVDGDLKD